MLLAENVLLVVVENAVAEKIVAADHNVENVNVASVVATSV